MQRWRQAWETGGAPGLASKGRRPGVGWMRISWRSWTGCWMPGRRPQAWEDQRWTLARVRDLIRREFGVRYTVPGTWYLLNRHHELKIVKSSLRKPPRKANSGCRKCGIVHVMGRTPWPA